MRKHLSAAGRALHNDGGLRLAKRNLPPGKTTIEIGDLDEETILQGVGRFSQVGMPVRIVSTGVRGTVKAVFFPQVIVELPDGNHRVDIMNVGAA